MAFMLIESPSKALRALKVPHLATLVRARAKFETKAQRTAQ
jgi:hypothetical protein